MFRQPTLHLEREDAFRAFNITNDSMMDPFNTVDEDTLALILQLQVEDANGLFMACEGKGKGHEGSLTDTQSAPQLQREELERSVSILTDRKMTKSLARACPTGGMYNLCFVFLSSDLPHLGPECPSHVGTFKIPML